LGNKLEILWAKPAKEDLQNIHDFLAEVSSLAAFNVITRIIDKVEILKSGLTQIGQVEELLKEREFEYRYLVEGNYKIIYRSFEQGVVILAVFDARQNPEKLKNKKA